LRWLPNPEDAARCIEALDGHNEELHHELDAMDQWVEKLRSKTKEPQDEKPSITPH
jgi:predicted RNase H-like nuclease (RuvC/YqgF family)